MTQQKTLGNFNNSGIKGLLIVISVSSEKTCVDN